MVIAQKPTQSLAAPHRPIALAFVCPRKQQDVALPLVIPLCVEMVDIVGQCPPQRPDPSTASAAPTATASARARATMCGTRRCASMETIPMMCRKVPVCSSSTATPSPATGKVVAPSGKDGTVVADVRAVPAVYETSALTAVQLTRDRLRVVRLHMAVRAGHTIVAVEARWRRM